MLKRWRFKPLFVFSFVLIVLAILAITVNIQYYFSNKIVEDSLEKYISVLSSNISSEVEEMERKTRNVISLVEISDDINRPFSVGEFHPIIKNIGLSIENNNQIYAGYLGYPDGRFLELINLASHPDLKKVYQTSEEERWLVVKVFREDGVATRYDEFLDADYQLLRTEVYETDYNPSLRPWFIQAKDANEIIKTQPYQYSLFDTTGVTFAKEVPQSGLTIGIDISARTLEEYLDGNTAVEGSKIILISKGGQVVATTKNLANLDPDDFIYQPSNKKELIEIAGEKYIYEQAELDLSLEFVNKISLLIPRKELFKSFNTIMATQMVSNLLFIFLMLIITWLYARYNSKLRADKVTALLNNSGEGFLSFTSDLIIDSQFSQACKKMLGVHPAGRNFADLLFADDQEKSQLIKQVIPAVLAQEDDFIKDSMISLLPDYAEVGDYKLKVRYRHLGEENFMVVLTDISERIKISKQLDKERKNLKMVVQAISDSHSFFQATESFKEFVSYYKEMGLDTSNLSEVATSLYREVHTYKGLLAQYNFTHTPELLHRVESCLSLLKNLDRSLTADDLLACFNLEDLTQAFNADLQLISATLGEEFLEQGRKFIITEEQAYKLQQLAEDIDKASSTTEIAELKSLSVLREFSCITQVSLFDSLANYNSLVKQVSLRLEKQVADLSFAGKDVWIDPKKYKGFLQSLVHIFRNSVLHGIEDPDTRLKLGKEEVGLLCCTTQLGEKEVKLTISDDGAGIDLAKLYEKAKSSFPDLPNDLSEVELVDLIFLDKLSTTESVNDLAGRGVGLSAVKAEVEKLNGRIEVETKLGLGTSFSFYLPMDIKTDCSN